MKPKNVEGSKADMAIDKKTKAPEGSMTDMKTDKPMTSGTVHHKPSCGGNHTGAC